MKFENVLDLQQSILRCNLDCPFKNDAAGCYPKPPKGPQSSKIMIIFENPGAPGGKNLGVEGNPEMRYNRANITLEHALRLATEGQRNWLFRRLGLNKQIWTAAGIEIGSSVYTTDSHKCPNPKDPGKAAAKSKEKARRQCLGYLQAEIRLVNPRIIIAFGDYARRSLADAENVHWDGGIKAIEKGDRAKIVGNRMYAILPHPDGLWRNPTMSVEAFEESLEFVFQAAQKFANAC